jgi:hypothetical protein
VDTVIPAVPSTWRLGYLVRRLFVSGPATYETAGSEAGARFATQSWADDQIGSTSPPGVAIIEARAVGELAVVAAAFERDRGRWRQRLRRRGANLQVRRTGLLHLVADEPGREETAEPGGHEDEMSTEVSCRDRLREESLTHVAYFNVRSIECRRFIDGQPGAQVQSCRCRHRPYIDLAF